jgi:hypothetical protein
VVFLVYAKSSLGTHARAIGWVAQPLFNHNGQLMTGIQSLGLWTTKVDPITGILNVSLKK